MSAIAAFCRWKQSTNTRVPWQTTCPLKGNFYCKFVDNMAVDKVSGRQESCLYNYRMLQEVLVIHLPSCAQVNTQQGTRGGWGRGTVALTYSDLAQPCRPLTWVKSTPPCRPTTRVSRCRPRLSECQTNDTCVMSLKHPHHAVCTWTLKTKWGVNGAWFCWCCWD